jgi:superfamily II DNA helicase RecQ
MTFQVITIPFDPVLKAFNAADINAFCLNKKVIRTQVEFFQENGSAFWSVFIEYETILSPITKSDPEIKGLTEAGRLCYEKLRQWRKDTADKEGIPPFLIAKNTHLVEIVQKELSSLESLKQIDGFGKKKLEKYGKEITEIIKTFYPKPVSSTEQGLFELHKDKS